MQFWLIKDFKKKKKKSDLSNIFSPLTGFKPKKFNSEWIFKIKKNKHDMNFQNEKFNLNLIWSGFFQYDMHQIGIS